MQHYLKFSCSLVLIGLLGTSCQKEALVVPNQSVSAASTSGNGPSSSRAPSSRSSSNKTGPEKTVSASKTSKVAPTNASNSAGPTVVQISRKTSLPINIPNDPFYKSWPSYPNDRGGVGRTMRPGSGSRAQGTSPSNTSTGRSQHPK